MSVLQRNNRLVFTMVRRHMTIKPCAYVALPRSTLSCVEFIEDFPQEFYALPIAHQELLNKRTFKLTFENGKAHHKVAGESKDVSIFFLF